MVHLTLGTMFAFGNILPYLASYMASKNGGQSKYNHYSSQCIWIYTVMGMAQAVGAPIGSKVEGTLGPATTTLIGCMTMSGAVLLTYFTCFNLYLTILTYGAMMGFGIGIAYNTPLVVGMRWFPNHKGAVTGVIILGFGMASSIFDLVMTEFINPNNIKQDEDYGFTNDPSVLDNVPPCFIKLGVIFIALQLIGCFLLKNPNVHHQDGLLQNEEEGNDKANLTEREVLKDGTFWNLWFTFSLNAFCLTFFSTEWKNFSDQQLQISNDRFLSIMGSISSVFDGLGRLFWSSWMDKNGSYRLTMGTMTFIATLLLGTWPFLWMFKYLHPILVQIAATIWLSGLFMTICGSFSVFPTQIANVYGSNNNGVVYGFLFTSCLPSSLIGSLGIIYVQRYFGWYFTSWTFCLCGLVAFILTMRSAKSKKIEDDMKDENEGLESLGGIKAVNGLNADLSVSVHDRR